MEREKIHETYLKMLFLTEAFFVTIHMFSWFCQELKSYYVHLSVCVTLKIFLRVGHDLEGLGYRDWGLELHNTFLLLIQCISKLQ